MDPALDAALAPRFRVHARLGEGGFGTVFLAERVGGELGRQVAIKVPHPDRMSAELVARLRDEARLGALIRHRAIVRVDDLVEVGGTWVVVMEYVEGCDLAELLHAGAVPPRAALAIAEEVAHALHAAYHQAGPDGPPLRLVHRDLKPSNLRVTAAGEVKLLDFGVARADFGAREAAGTGAVLGTHTYLAPERFEGTDSHAGDVYALGVTLFELLTGTPPGKSAFDADRQPPGRKYADQWRWLGTVHPDLPPLLARLLATDPAARPTAREAARAIAALRIAVGGVTLEDWAEAEVPRRLAGAQGEPVLPSGSLHLERAPSARSPRRLPVLVGLGLAAVVFVGGSFALARHGDAAGPVAAIAGDPDARAVLAEDPVSVAPIAVAPAEAVAAPAEVAVPAPAAGNPVAGITPRTAVPPVAPAAEAAVAPPTPAPSRTPTRRSRPAASVGAPSAAIAAASSPPESAPASSPAPASGPSATGPGTVVLGGDARSVSLHPSGALSALPPGTYAADVTLSDGQVVSVDSFTVAPGGTVTLTCSITYLRCRVSAR